MCGRYILLLAGLIALLTGCMGILVSRWLESPHVTNWGDWDNVDHFCDENAFVNGISLKIEPSQGQRFGHNDDDTALNAVHLHCADLNGYDTKILQPHESQWGTWGGIFRCYQGYAIGFQLRSESDQRSKDDTAAVDMALLCPNSNGIATKLVGGSVHQYGYWSDEQYCPPETAVCGINTQIERPQGKGDDTALNNVRIACCPFPQQTKRQNALYFWVK